MSRFTIDTLLDIDSSDPDRFDQLCDVIERLKFDDENDVGKLKRAFGIAQFALRTQMNELDDLEKGFSDEMRDLKRQLETMKFSSGRDDRELETEITKLENKNDALRNDVQDLEAKLYAEATEKDKLNAKIEELEKSVNKYKRETIRLEEDVKEYSRQVQIIRDEKYLKHGDQTTAYSEKLKSKNKLISELEEENSKLMEEAQKLDNLLQTNRRELEDAMYQMNRTTDEIKKLRLLQQQSDIQIDQYKKETDVLKVQISALNGKLMTQHGHDSVILNSVEAKIKEYNQILQVKDDEIRSLQELVFNLKDNLSRIKMDSDKNSVAFLTKAIQEKDNEIELLKRQIEECTREMDKGATMINNLAKTASQNNKTMSQNYVNREAEQKVKFLENMLRENEHRVRDAEEQVMQKEKELTDALNRLDAYESGDYQLQDAVNEIKSLKGQIKIRDRDIETLTKHLTKIDFVLNDALEENDDLRAKLGMEPKEKINLDELKDLKANRAQENRAFVHVLKKEIEGLEEERIKLKEQIRKLAKQAGAKVNVASLLDDESDLYTDRRKSKTDQKDDKSKNHTVKDPSIELEDLRKKNEMLLQLQSEYQRENRELEQGLRELHKSFQNIKGIDGHKIIDCPTLDRLLEAMEANKNSALTLRNFALFNFSDVNASGADGKMNFMLFKSEIDYLQGRNEELRLQLAESRNNFSKLQIELDKAQEENARTIGTKKGVNKNTNAINNKVEQKVEIFQPAKLPTGISPSSKDIISNLNEYLIDTLHELDEYKQINATVEKDLEKLKRKYSVQRHQLSVLYKDHIDDTTNWKDEKTRLTNEIKTLQNTIQVDSVKLQEYDRLLDTLSKDDVEVRRRLAESSRQMYVVRTSEKQLTLKCSSLEDLEQKMLKENNKLRTEIIQIEVNAKQRVGYLERYKEMANFKILSYQKQLEECISSSKLDDLNKKYDELVQSYRQLLNKQDSVETKAENLSLLEEQNKKYQADVEFLRNELQNEKERVHILEESLEKMKSYSNIFDSSSTETGKNGKHMHQTNDVDSLSTAKRVAVIEMKELNERQRADYAQRMYDEQRNLLRQIENRNLELENNFSQLTKSYLNLQKTEQNLREELVNCVSKAISDTQKARINELEKNELSLKLEVTRLKELTEITLYQAESLDFIQKLNKKEVDCLGSIDVATDDLDQIEVGKLHRNIIMLQISEATAIRKLQNALDAIKKLETQLLRTEQKLDKEQEDAFNTRKEYISKISYLKSTIQDLRHKYSGSIPLKQQEKFEKSKQDLLDTKKQLLEKIKKIDFEKNELEDKIAEYEVKMQSIDILKTNLSSDPYKTNEKIIEWYKKIENLKTTNMKLERSNKRCRDEMKFLEDMNRKMEIALVSLEEESVKIEKEFDQRVLLWEHREADLERTIENLKQQHKYIESLAVNFEEISGKLPDSNLPIPNQLDQAIHIIRDHIKLLAESKIQADLLKKRITEVEDKLRKCDNDVCIRDKVIAELRLRLPASSDREHLIEVAMQNRNLHSDSTSTPDRVAQSTIESLQNRLNQKEQTIIKYQDLLKLSRDEINKLNKQHEIEINNLMEKLNNTRDSDVKKLKENLKFTPRTEKLTTKNELIRLQELEEVTVEQDNTISALNDKVRKLNSEIESGKLKYEVLLEKFKTEKENLEREKNSLVEKFNHQIEQYKGKVKEQEQEMQLIIADLENQKQLNSKSPTNTMKALVDKLKQQLNEKELQHKNLTKALGDLRNDMVNISKSNLLGAVDEQNHVKEILGKNNDKINLLEEELLRLRNEVKMKSKVDDDLRLENEHLNSQLKIKEQKIKKLLDDQHRLLDDTKRFYDKTSLDYLHDTKINESDYLKRRIKELEAKLRMQKPAERPYDTSNNVVLEKLRERVKTLETENQALRNQIKQKSDTSVQTVHTPVNQSNTMQQQRVAMETNELHQKYHYILNENTILKKEKHDLEINIIALRRENDLLKNQLENEVRLRDDIINRTKQQPKTQTFTLSKYNNEDFLKKITKLNEENMQLRSQIDDTKDYAKLKNKNEELLKYIELLKAEKEQLKDKSETSTATTSGNLRRVGQSGKSTDELEKTIALMKKIITKLQHENEELKSNSLSR